MKAAMNWSECPGLSAEWSSTGRAYDTRKRAVLRNPEEELIRDKALHALADGKSVIMNCCFGFGVGVGETDDGRAKLEVIKDIISPGYDGPAIRSFMEETAVAWLRQVAPHRLALGADDR